MPPTQTMAARACSAIAIASVSMRTLAESSAAINPSATAAATGDCGFCQACSSVRGQSNIPAMIETLADALRSAGRVTVLTGSGLSAGSAVSTFRDAQSGLWARHRPEDPATPEDFERDPATVWQWYRERRRLAIAGDGS